MSDERGTIEPGTILIIVCVISVFAIALFYAARSNTKRGSMIQDFARAHGWNYAKTDIQGLSAKIDPYFPDSVFHLDNIVTIGSNGSSIHFFDCGYHYRERRRGDMFGNGCVIESDRFRTVHTQLEIVARNWADAAMLSDQVAWEDSEFFRNFIVISKDQAAAREVLSTAVQQVLLEHCRKPLFNPVRISITKNGAVILTGLNAEPERWLDLIDLAQRVEAGLN